MIFTTEVMLFQISKKHFSTFDFLVKMKLVSTVVHINSTILIWLMTVIFTIWSTSLFAWVRVTRKRVSHKTISTTLMTVGNFVKHYLMILWENIALQKLANWTSMILTDRSQFKESCHKKFNRQKRINWKESLTSTKWSINSVK